MEAKQKFFRLFAGGLIEADSHRGMSNILLSGSSACSQAASLKHEDERLLSGVVPSFFRLFAGGLIEAGASSDGKRCIQVVLPPVRRRPH